MTLSIPLDIIVFLIGTFMAAFVTGVAGFAFGMVAAAIWMHALLPAQTTVLIAAYALLVQGYAVWKLRKAIAPMRLWPFIIGSAIGVPAGLAVLRWVPAVQLRLGVGLLLISFSIYNLLRPKIPSLVWAGRMSDGYVGVLNGAHGAATGLGGILPTIWSGMRGWTRDEQRAVFQPTAVFTFLICLLALGGTGIVTRDMLQLFAIGLPALLFGTLLGRSTESSTKSRLRDFVIRTSQPCSPENYNSGRHVGTDLHARREWMVSSALGSSALARRAKTTPAKGSR
jgi:uncharacterized membrane protein YfcA